MAAHDEAAEEEFRQRVGFLSEVSVFRCLPKSEYPLLARSLHDQHWIEGDTVCQAGAEIADFFLVAKGSAKILLKESDLELGTLHPGDYFGAKALDHGQARISPVTIIADKNLVTLELSAKKFDKYGLGKVFRFPGRAAGGDPMKVATGLGLSLQGRQCSIGDELNSNDAGNVARKDCADEVLSCLEGVAILHGLWASEKRELLQSFQLQEFQADDWVVHEGEHVRNWFIVVTGEVTCYHQVEGQMQELAHLGTYMHFGERALLQSKPSEVSFRVTSARARCLLMEREDFLDLADFLRAEPLLISAKDASLQAFVAEQKAVPLHQVSSSGRRVIRRERTDISNLTRIGVLGSGSYGLVTLESDQRTGQKIAVKTISKGHIVESCSQQHVKRERELLQFMDSPFIVRLIMTSQDNDNLYFYFDPALGGDLRTLGSRSPDLFVETSKVTNFMVLCVVAAFGYIHERAIVFRDLKPENVLINSAGVAQLCDFGLARLLLGKAFTILGTPEYLAPEVVKRVGYDRMVDWWALGVLTYELLAGTPPFGEADDAGVQGVVRNIVRGLKSTDDLPFDSANAKLFILRLLEADPQKRLGKNGSREVADMPYLKNSFDYEQFCNREVQPPYVPQIDSDLSAFDQDVELPPVVPYTPDSSDWDVDF